jgi:hypothetical protein
MHRIVLAREACEPLVPELPGNICLLLSSEYPLNIKGLRQSRGDSIGLPRAMYTIILILVDLSFIALTTPGSTQEYARNNDESILDNTNNKLIDDEVCLKKLGEYRWRGVEEELQQTYEAPKLLKVFEALCSD